MVKICVITYKRLNQLVREAIDTYVDDELCYVVIEGLRNEILEVEKREIIEACDVIIAGGANARIAKENFEIPVVPYKITDMDYIWALRRATDFGNNIAIVTYQVPIPEKNFIFYQDEVKGNVSNLIYEDTEELCEKLQKEDYDVVIGAAHAVEIGEMLGKHTVLIYPGVNSIQETITNAKELVCQIREEREKMQFSSALLQYHKDGVLLIDAEGMIAGYNSEAVRILRMKASELRGCYLKYVYPELRLMDMLFDGKAEEKRSIFIDHQEILVHTIKLERVKDRISGGIVILENAEDVKETLSLEKKKQKSREEKGFAAKKKFSDILGTSKTLMRCIDDAKYFAKSDASVMIRGETGVGKELFAQSIHNHSMRKNEVFVAINCAALPESLLESELFGYDEGAFTGSRRNGKKGLFELADKGTIFLDEIGEISPSLQARLLRVLQEKEIMRVGGDKIIPVNVRILSATNRDLEHMNSMDFRRDLYYRLNVLELNVPPLREREGDVVILFEQMFQSKADIPIHHMDLTDDVKHILQLYSWPGNIRELQNVAERFCLYLNRWSQPSQKNMKRCLVKAIGEERMQQALFQYYGYDGSNITKELVEELKTVFSINREQIAQLLGVSRTTIWRLTGDNNKNVSKYIE